MRKFIAGLVVGILLTASFSVAANSNIKIIVDGKELNTDKAYISEGVTMVPLRVIAEALDFNVKWEAETRIIFITSKDKRTKLTLPEIERLILPAVVTIQAGNEIGTGFFVTPNKIITCAHVVKDYNEATAVTKSGTIINASLTKINRDWDLALLNVSGNYAYIDKIGPDPKFGDMVFSFPYGLNVSVNQGLVDGISEFTPDTWASSARTLQHRATTGPGSSGGPVVNEYGELVGITYASLESIGVSYAVCASYVQKMLE